MSRNPPLYRLDEHRSRRVCSFIDSIGRLTDSTVACVVLVDRHDGSVSLIPHPHTTHQALELMASIDWKNARYIQAEFDLD